MKRVAEAREPPVVIPIVVVLADAHETLAEPMAKRGEAPVALGVFPMSTVRLLISEGGIGFIHGGGRDRIGRLEAARLELLFEVVIGDETVAVREGGFEEHDLDRVALALRHRIHALAVRVLRATSGFDRLLLRAT